MSIRYNERTGEFEEDSSQKSKEKISSANRQSPESESVSERIMWEVIKFVACIAAGCLSSYIAGGYDSEYFFIGAISGVIFWLVCR